MESITDSSIGFVFEPSVEIKEIEKVEGTDWSVEL